MAQVLPKQVQAYFFPTVHTVEPPPPLLQAPLVMSPLL
jgi:hypothetical protein